MNRRSHLAHITAVLLLGACLGLAEETAWSKTPTKTAMAPKTKAGQTYVVRSGDSWSAIAHAQGTTMPKLLAANHATTTTTVHPGDKIKLPADAKAPSRAAPAAKKTAPAAAASAKPR